MKLAEAISKVKSFEGKVASLLKAETRLYFSSGQYNTTINFTWKLRLYVKDILSDGIK